MRKLFLLLNLFLITGLCFAQNQVQVKLSQPPPNQLRSTDLWKATITNPTKTTYRISFEVTLDEKAKGHIADGHSAVMDLPPGTKNITYDDVKTWNLKSIFDRWGNFVGGTINAPSGEYTICIKVKDESGKEIGSGCIVQSVQSCDVNLTLKLKSVECLPITHGNNNYKICVSATYTASVYNLTYLNSGSGFKAYPPSYSPFYTISNISPVLQVQNSGSTTTVNYCFDVSVPVGQTAIKVGLQGDDKDPGPIVCQPGAELDIKLPNCITCDCGKWTPLVLNLATGPLKYECGSKIPWKCNQPFKFEISYQCNPNNESCQAKTSWEIKKDGVSIKTGSGTNNIADAFTPTTNGIYTITLNASCNGIKCPSCIYTIVVEDCITCSCGTWNPLLVNNIKYDCGSKIPWKCNQPFKFASYYQCSPNNESCQAKTTWEIKKDGVSIKTGSGTNNITDSFTPTANGIYTITLNATCNGIKCPSCIYTIVVEDCITCSCGTWTPLLLNLATGQLSYKCDSRIEWNCNKPFKFEISYQCNPNNESCQAKTSWEIKKDGVSIKTGSGTNNITDGFTPTANGTYTITLNASCNGIKCPPCTYTIIVKDCKICECGTWSSLSLQSAAGTIRYDCGSKIDWSCNRQFSFATSYQCSPNNDPNCQAKTTWEIKKDGVSIKTGSGTNSITDSFTPNVNGTYTITLNASCNGIRCTSCTYTIIVKDCLTCDCNKDMWVILNPGNIKIRCKETKILDYGTTITLIPQNICEPADCLSKWSMKVYDAQSGALITTGSGTGNSSSFNLTLNSIAGYRIVLVGNCNGKECSCEFWIRTKPVSGLGCNLLQFAPANLNVGTMIVSNSPGSMQTNNGIIEKYCYNNVAANCATYGGLYEWGEAMGYAASNNNDQTGPRVQGICPTGYHIPSNLEWARYEYCIESTIPPTGSTTLVTFQTTTFSWMGTSTGGVGPGAKMKATSPGWDGTNTSGFKALPAGERVSGVGSFSDLGSWTAFWSSTESSAVRGWYQALNPVVEQIGRNNTQKDYGLSVRCLKDY